MLQVRSLPACVHNFADRIAHGLRRLALVKLSLLASIVLPCNSAFAWENDVHYGLTKWLAPAASSSGDLSGHCVLNGRIFG